jgi:ribonuclease HII
MQNIVQKYQVMPSLSEAEYAGLKADIAERGVLVPVERDENGDLLDGYHRAQICEELGITDIPTIIRPGLTEQEKRDHARALNLHRRHLNSEQKRQTIASQLLETPERSNRQIAETLNVDDKTVGAVRRQMEATAEIPQLSRTVGMDGKSRAVRPAIVSATSRDTQAALAGIAKVGVENLPQGISPASFVAKIVKSQELAEVKESFVHLAKSGGGYASVCCTDALEFLCGLPVASADLLLTDPPYMTDVEDIQSFAHRWLPAALSRLKRSARAYVCVGAYPDELLAYLSAPRAGFELAQVLSWTYRNTLGPSPTHDYKLNWQAILYFRGPDAVPLDCPVMNEQFSVQDINAPDGRLANRFHEWQKPDELAERFIRHSTTPGQIVIDPFAGTGTFLAAAARLGRQGFGSELDAGQISLCEKRGILSATGGNS